MSEVNHKDAVRSQFGSTAQSYVDSPTHRSGQDIVRLVELTEPSLADCALDIATGGGHTALALAPHVKSVIASDLTPQMLAAAERHITSTRASNVAFRLADAEELPFGDEAFDIVTCRIAPHHFGDVEAFAAQVSRVLKPGGRFVLMDSISPEDDALDAFINELEWRRDKTHVRSYRVDEWIQNLTNSGLTVDHQEQVIRSHDYEDWTARSKMTATDRSALDDWIRSHPDKTLDYFEFKFEGQDIVKFIDHKVLLRARKEA